MTADHVFVEDGHAINVPELSDRNHGYAENRWPEIERDETPNQEGKPHQRCDIEHIWHDLVAVRYRDTMPV